MQLFLLTPLLIFVHTVCYRRAKVNYFQMPAMEILCLESPLLHYSEALVLWVKNRLLWKICACCIMYILGHSQCHKIVNSNVRLTRDGSTSIASTWLCLSYSGIPDLLSLETWGGERSPPHQFNSIRSFLWRRFECQHLNRNKTLQYKEQHQQM